MARALIVERREVSLPERADYVDRLPGTKAHYKDAGCHFWVFEDHGERGAFLEFIESSSAERLTAALASAPARTAGMPPLYIEVEIS